MGWLRLVLLGVEFGHGLDLHVAALQLLLVVLLQQDGPDEPDDGLFVGEDADHVRSPLHLFVQPFQWIGAVQLDPVLRRERHVSQHIVLGFIHETGEFWPFAAKLVGDMPLGLAGAGRIRLQKGLAQGGRNHGVLSLGDASQGVSHPVDPATLPCGSERLGDGGLETFMGIGDDQLYAGEASTKKAFEEKRPERLGLAGTDVQSHDFPAASLIETAKANDLEPYRYLRHLFEHLPTATSDAQRKALLPQYIDPKSLIIPA